MAEIFTINGAGYFGAAGCPAGWKATPNGNCGGASGSSSAATSMQNALQALGRAVGGDNALSNLSADGYIGPATTAAVNRAFTVHIGAGQAPAQYRTGSLSMYDVAANAPTLTSLIAAEVSRRGGSLTVSPPKAGSKAPVYTAPGTSPDSGLPGGLSLMQWTLIGVGGAAIIAGAYYMMHGKGKAMPMRRRYA